MIIENFDTSEKVFIIAELSANHGHDIQIAKDTIKAAKQAGADAIKLQTYTADTLTIDCDNDYFKLDSGTIWDGRTLYDLYSEAYTPWEWHKELQKYAEELSLIFFSSPFDFTAVDFLEELNVPAYKIASFEIQDTSLIKYAASKGKPMIISTGIAEMKDIQLAIKACNDVGNYNIILLKCTSAYPAKIENANLKTMKNMQETFNVEVGLSDHTIGSNVPIVATALGARVIEKHFILNKNIGGPDSSFSMEPKEFSNMVKEIRNAEKSIGEVDYSMSNQKMNSKKIGRSLFVVEDLKKGELFTSKNLRSIRPGDGLNPKYYEDILGRTAKSDISRGTPLSFSHFSD